MHKDFYPTTSIVSEAGRKVLSQDTKINVCSFPSWHATPCLKTLMCSPITRARHLWTLLVRILCFSVNSSNERHTRTIWKTEPNCSVDWEKQICVQTSVHFVALQWLLRTPWGISYLSAKGSCDHWPKVPWNLELVKTKFKILDLLSFDISTVL